MKTVLNWSTGKDSALTYLLLSQNPEYEVKHLLTVIDREDDRVFTHGVRESLLDAQAQMMNIPLRKVKLLMDSDNMVYQDAMCELLIELKQENIKVSAFGDIFLEDVRFYRELFLAQMGLRALFPLWKKDSIELVKSLEDVGIEAVIVCVNDHYLGKEFLGRKVDSSLLADLPANVDPCGENGEYHTFTYNAPFFSAPIPIVKGAVFYKERKSIEKTWGFHFLDLQMAI